MTRVKVCGLTRVEDALLSADLGAWALGFVLTDSPRRVSVADAAGLITEVRRPRDGGAGGGRHGGAQGGTPRP